MLVVFIILLIPAIILASNYKWFKKKLHPFWLLLISIASIYVLVVGYSEFIQYQLTQKLYEYDLDGNGSFSREEQTPEQKDAMLRVISDTGRALAPISGAIFATGYSILFFGTFSSGKWIFNKLKRTPI
jgi:hypothetical protein